VLVLHGDDAQIVPIGDVERRSVKLLRKGELPVIPERSHGMCARLADRSMRRLLAFIKG
jgi:hypothetical protein